MPMPTPSIPPPPSSAASAPRAPHAPVPLRAPAAYAPALPVSALSSAPPVQRATTTAPSSVIPFPTAPSPTAAPSVTRLHAPAAPVLPDLPVPVQRSVPTALKSFWKKLTGSPASSTQGPPPSSTPGTPPPPNTPAEPPPPYTPGPPPPYSLHGPHPGGGGPHSARSFDPRDLSDAQLDELTHRLIGPITRLLRTELRMDRERIGRLRDPRV
ncbi:extensin [Streptomyces prasinus]|uniref:extensin n=1 Tax=Streptomyces prasinus TaxID=67345 RepID=UPI0033CF356E